MNKDPIKSNMKEVEGRVQEESGKVTERKPAPPKTNIPEDDRDVRKPSDVESDVVPNRDDEIGEEVA